MSKPKTLGNTTAEQTEDNVQDVKSWGAKNMFKLITKAWSIEEEWSRSTKAMEIRGVGCVIQVSTILEGIPSEALSFVPGVRIREHKQGDKVISRTIVAIKH